MPSSKNVVGSPPKSNGKSADMPLTEEVWISVGMSLQDGAGKAPDIFDISNGDNSPLATTSGQPGAHLSFIFDSYKDVR